MIATKTALDAPMTTRASAALVEAQDLRKEYRLGENIVAALKRVSLRVEAGEFLAIIGPSGSGKSTLLNLIGCIEKPSAGRIRIDGIDVTEMPLDDLARVRSHKLGYVFQTFNVLPVLTVAENLAYPLWLQRTPKAQVRDRVREALAQVGLERHAGHKPRELSGGQRQRVAIARALIGRPILVLADEPTANLDQRTGMEIIELMRELNRRTKTTFILSTHDPKIMSMAGRRVELADGSLN